LAEDGIMNPELYMVFLPAIGWLLFALGGTKISDTIPGKKWLRRWIMPLVFGVTVYTASTGAKALEVAATLAVVLILGYGDNSPWWKKVLVGCAYGCVSWALGFSWWNVITAAGFIFLFVLSNWKKTAQIWVWKICEGSIGALLGIQVAYKLIGG
jgi:hypothetical protein